MLKTGFCFKDPGRSKYNHTSMESLVDVEYKYIRVNIVFPFHKLQDAERTSHCPPPPSYVTYLVRLAETLMTSFRVGVARDVRPLELLWLARARTQSEWLLYTITIATVLLWAEFVKFCESFDLAMAASVNQDDLLEVLENEEGDTKLASGSLE